MRAWGRSLRRALAAAVAIVTTGVAYAVPLAAAADPLPATVGGSPSRQKP